MAYGVAPKVQGTAMQPRQQAMQRRATGSLVGTGLPNNIQKPPPPPLAVNTQHGLQMNNHLTGNTPHYGLNPNAGKPGKDVNGNPVTNAAPGKIGKYGHVVQTPQAVTGVAPVATNADPLGTGDPELDKYLAGDDIYQSILASITRNKDTNQVNYDYNVKNQTADNETIRRRLAESEVKDNKLLDDDYAARGLFNSGLELKASSDLGQNYSNQGKDLESAFQRNLYQLLTDQTSQNDLDNETGRQAQLDAITRRAQEFGIMGGPTIDSKPGKDGKNGKDGKDGKGGKNAPAKTPPKKDPPKSSGGAVEVNTGTKGKKGKK